MGGGELWGSLHALLVTCCDEEFIPEEWTKGIIVGHYLRKGMSVM